MRGCVCSIVPPHLFERIARHGSAEEREAALDTLSIDHSIRLIRAQNAALATPPFRRAVGTLGAHGQCHRTIFDAQNRNDQHATALLRDEGQPECPDAPANEAYEGLGDTYRFYWEVLTRDSIDDASMSLLGEVHFGRRYDNAFWDGERMMFGDGSGTLFTGFTRALEVIGHELTHGVTEKTINLRYSGQSGALNESISDVFGSLVKQYKLGQTADQANWLIVDGILGPAMHGVALRSMEAPGTAFDGDNQPATMDAYVATTSDNGGVHTNSGIPNHAFYLVATAIGGYAWERAGRIWYQVLASRAVPPDAQFHTFASATLAAATGLYGATSTEAKAVADAWSQVGVLSASQLPTAAAVAT
ncbi:MAG TPA: M4 family metallopeptidase [Candidatus Dormibacteraeota bacterium]|nr:M4 family metallopeptidase [Candidatus Dormibacteraeota bacterium]